MRTQVKKPTARMKAQEPCSEHCVGSRHLHLDNDDAEVVLVGYGQWEDQYLSVGVGRHRLYIKGEELRALGRGIITEKPKRRRK